MGNLTGRYVDAVKTDVRPTQALSDDKSKFTVRRPNARLPVPKPARADRPVLEPAVAGSSGKSSKAVLSEAKRGRPRIEDRHKTIEAQKPWLALGMARRTWYDRKAKGELK